MQIITYSDFIHAVEETEGTEILTIGGNSKFKARRSGEAVEFTPSNTHRQRRVSKASIERYIDRYNQTQSTRTSDYNNAHHHRSYVLAVLRRVESNRKHTSDPWEKRKLKDIDALSYSDPVIFIRWKDGESKDLIDVFPISWFRTESTYEGLVHEIFEPGSDKSFGRCDVRVSGLAAVLDYRPYRVFNTKNSTLLGEIRLTFSSNTRSFIKKVEWRSFDSEKFLSCKFNVIVRQKDVTAEIIAHNCTPKCRADVALLLELIRDVCKTCIVEKRFGPGWIFVPANRWGKQRQKEKNLITIWPRRDSVVLRIMLPLKNRGENPRSPDPESFDSERMHDYRRRMLKLLSDTPRFASNVPQSFQGTFKSAAEDGEFKHNPQSPVHDMAKSSKGRDEAGRRAEQIALEAERENLRQAGREDLAKRVKLVSDRPKLGYDIASFEPDESERRIEVKNISNGYGFFLSHNEWRKSQHLENYWFYLVDECKGCPRVEQVIGKKLMKSHLRAVQYFVTFDR